MGDTTDKLRLQRFHQKVATSTSFVQPETVPPTSSAVMPPCLPPGANMEGGIKLGPHLHPQNLGWKAVEGKLLPMQCDMDVAQKALLKVVRCNCKMGYDTLRCSCRKAELNCSTGCGVSRLLC